MSGFGKRVSTIGVLLAGSPVDQTVDAAVLRTERAALAHSQRIAVSRRYLVQIVHTTRLLDTFLKLHLPLVGVKAGTSLGSHLHNLRWGIPHSAAIQPTVARLAKSRKTHYQTRVVVPRNKFMHEAGAFPTSAVADDLLADMQACLAEVLQL